MSTHSQIGILTPNGKVLSVYCHLDGYPSHMGTLLIEHYNSVDLANAILGNGYYSSLGESLDPQPDPRNHDGRFSDFGRNEDTREIHPSTEAFYHATDNCGGEWAYLWDTLADCWVCTKIDRPSSRKRKGIKGITWSRVTPEWVAANPD